MSSAGEADSGWYTLKAKQVKIVEVCQAGVSVTIKGLIMEILEGNAVKSQNGKFWM